ncbi:MAG: hypothetical protein UX98_C0018G0031 [Parcubacteria group bacterium GW2011_GWA2_47_26]|nr:MAG: hypothetical protein UX98_C0018G0031 [Parcubacteria group bacterium GW2011_GWA2_47_26]
MKLRFEKNIISDPVLFIKRCGYGEYYDRRMKKVSYMRRARGSDMFPRFHVYIMEHGEDVVFDLHLDQKRPSYAGSSMHAGEYEGTAVEKEAERIRSFLQKP